jgi:hypothetical protein
MPQLEVDRHANKGISMPARRRAAAAGCAITLSFAPARDVPQNAANAVAELFGTRQQADHEKRFTWEVEEVARVGDDAFAFHEIHDEILFGVERRDI